MASALDIVVVTGLSGAGRSTALRVLEDLGFYCVDNLPPVLATELCDSVLHLSSLKKIGLGIDVRSGEFLQGADEMLSDLRTRGYGVEVIFLDCADEVLVRRFSETRRPHALAESGDLPEAIRHERKRLTPLRGEADHVIDTTELNVHELRRTLVDRIAKGAEGRRMHARLVSFGFKYGIPSDADLVFDVRFLPNPYFVDELRPLDGRAEQVAHYVLENPKTQKFLSVVAQLLSDTLPEYESEGKSYLTIAIGCTGGRHRSVAIVHELEQRLAQGCPLDIKHRDLGR